MRALVIGAGAIGQVFGRHLQQGGAQVSVLVRPKYADEARAGYAMYPLNRRASVRWTPIRWEGFGVFDSLDAAMAERPDLVVVATSSPALRGGTWFADLAGKLGDARLLALQPAPEDRDFVLAHVPAAQVVYGMLAIISFHAPLPGDALAVPGTAYWFPWGAGIGFSGPPAARDAVIAALRAGGMPTRALDDVHTEVAFTGAILDKTVVALQCAGWSFDALRRDPELLPLARRSMEESWALAAARSGKPVPFGFTFVRPATLGAILGLSGTILPLDLEKFFRVHYTKVAAQTILLQHDHLARFAAAGIACPATTELVARLERTRAAAAELPPAEIRPNIAAPPGEQ